MATPAEVETLREYFQGLSSEQRATFRTLVKDSRRKASAPIKSESGGTLSFPHRAIMRSENLDPSTPEGKVNSAMMLMMGFGGAAGSLLSAAKTGLPALGEAAVTMGGRTAAGAAIGGALGMTPLPLVGGHGAVEGAKFGAMMGAGQGGMGALWKHGKKKKILQYLIDKIGPKQADEVLEVVAAEVSQGVPRGMATSMARQADDVAGAVTARVPARTAGGAATTSPAMSAPVPAAGAAPPQGKTLGDIIHMEPTKTLKEGAARHVAASTSETVDKAFLEFVKKEGPKFKANSEVWFVKDASGTPLRTFESSAKAAGWVRRAENKGKGYVADFFKNFWGSSSKTKAVVPAPAAAKATVSATSRTLSSLKGATEKPWRVVIQSGKYKGKSGIKIKHGMGRGQRRPGGSAGPRQDTIRLDDGSEVVVPSTNVLTDMGKATHPSVQRAIDAAKAK